MFTKLLLLLLLPGIAWAADAAEGLQAIVPQKSCPFLSTHKLIPDITKALSTLKKCEPLVTKISAMEESIKVFKSQGTPITKGPVAEGAYRSYVGVDPTCQNYESIFSAELEYAQSRLALRLTSPPSKLFKSCYKANAQQNALMKDEVFACFRQEYSRALEYMRNQCGWLRRQSTEQVTTDLAATFVTQLQQNFDRLLKEDLPKCQDKQNWETIEKTALSTGIQLAGAVAALEPHAAMASMAVGLGAQALDQILNHIMARKPPSSYFSEQAELEKVECLFVETLDEVMGCKTMGNAADPVPDMAAFRQSLDPKLDRYYFGDGKNGSVLGALASIDRVVADTGAKGSDAVLNDRSKAPPLDQLRALKSPITLPDGSRRASQLEYLGEVANDLKLWAEEPDKAPVQDNRNFGPIYRGTNLEFAEDLERFVQSVERAFPDKLERGTDLKAQAKALLESVYRSDGEGNKKILDLKQILARHSEMKGNDPLSPIKQWEIRSASAQVPPANNQHLLEMGLTALLENFGNSFRSQMGGFITSLNNAKANSMRGNELYVAPDQRPRFFDGNYLNMIKTCLLIAPSLNHLEGSVEKGQKANYNVTSKRREAFRIRLGGAPPDIEAACSEFHCAFPAFKPQSDDLNGEFNRYQCRMLYAYDDAVRYLRSNFIRNGQVCPNVDQASMVRTLSRTRAPEAPTLRGRNVEQEASTHGRGWSLFPRLRR